MKTLKRLVLPVLVILILAIPGLSKSEFKDYWPDATWRSSTPEEQGMDSKKIYEALNYLIKNQNSHSVHSMLVIRNGYLVTEAYFNPYNRQARQIIYSAGKSFISSLMGIEMQEGLINNIHQKVLDMFPEYTFANITDDKKEMTIENLLTMTSGLDWRLDPSTPVDASLNFDEILTYLMIVSGDSVKFVLDRPMNAKQGNQFSYNSGATQILAAIIQKTSGMRTLNYAQKYLFRPLGIYNVDWYSDMKGIDIGGGGLCMTPFDMAKFGYLYLRHGVWNGKQIIPAEWVESSTQKHFNWQPASNINLEYGYHWWITPYGFKAVGLGGQFIFVIPKLDMVVVFTGGLKETADAVLNSFIPPVVENYLIPAVKSNETLPRNLEMEKEIGELLLKIEKPDASPIPPLPKITAGISGKVFQCDPNQGGYPSFSLQSFTMHSFSLRFFDQKDSCFLKFTANDGNSFNYLIGLDGIYRTSITGDSRLMAFKGSWISDNTFLVNWQVLQDAERFDLTFTFNGDQVAIDIKGSINGYYGKITGKMQK